MTKLTEQQLEKVGMKKILPLKPGYVAPACLDIVFKNLVNDKHHKNFLAKIISITTDIDYNFLLENMYITGNNTGEGNITEHHNEQDIIVSLDDMRINVEMSMNNKNENIRKNQITAHKYAANMFKVGDNYEEARIFYQICIENYNLFDNDLLITEVNLVEVSSGRYQTETDEFKRFHINLNNVSKECYNDLDERNRYFKFFLLDEIEELEKLSNGDNIMEGAVEKLKSMSEDSIFISELEKSQINEYVRKLALADERKEEKKEIAKNLLNQNVDVNIIANATGLTIEEINKLNKSNSN